MGCNKSLPVVLPKSRNPSSESTPSVTRRRPNRINTIEVGSINEELKILKALGTNDLGIMLYAQCLKTGLYRAIREVNKSQASGYTKMLQEVQILYSLDHPNIQKIYQIIETSISYYIVYESLNGGTLKSAIKRTGNELQVSKYLHDIISAVYYLHNSGFIHCDLTPTHILFLDSNDERIPKLIGFSNAQHIADVHEIDTKSINYIYMSPEMTRNTINEKTDMWSIGVITYELLVGKHPYLSKDKHDIIKEIYNGIIDFTNPGFLELSCSAQDFLRKLLEVDTEARLSAKQALDHSWMSLASKEYYMSYDALLKLKNFKMKSSFAKMLLKYILTKIYFEQNEMVNLFKSMDSDNDGIITRLEILEAFSKVGIDASGDIAAIMNNLDIDSSGTLEFTEITIAIVDWEKILKSKNLAKVFPTSQSKSISIESLKLEFPETLPHEWIDFSKKIALDDGFISLKSLKLYLKGQFA